MHAFYALLRPGWRALTWWWVLIGVIGVIIPLDNLSQALGACVGPTCVSSAWRALVSGEPAGPVRTAVWTALVLQSLWLGWLVGYVRAEVQNTTLGWTLPGLREKQLAATLVIGLIAAVPPTALMVNTGAGAISLATFWMALFWFLVPGVVFDAGVSPLVRGAVVLASLVSAFATAWHQQVVLAHPLAATMIAVAACAVLIATMASQRASRQRIELAAEMDLMPLHRTRGRISNSIWSPSLRSERRMDWVRAAMYETSPHGFLRTRLIHLLVVWLVLRVLDNPSMIFIVMASQFLYSGTLLTLGLHHPLSRRTQAGVAYTGALIDTAVFLVAGSVSLYLLLQLPMPVLPMPSSQGAPLRDWFLAAGVAVIFAPVLQLGGLRTRLSSPRRNPTNFAVIAWMIAYIVPASMLYAFASGRLEGSPITTAAWLLAAFVSIQAGYWWLLSEHYRNADLVPNS